MPIRVECPACGGSFEAPDEYRGRQGKCLHCNELVSLVASPPPIVNKNIAACKDCGKSISVNAKSCPHCGAPVVTAIDKVGTSVATIAAGGCGIVILLFFVGFLMLARSCKHAIDNPTPWQEQDNSAGAIVEIQNHVKLQLKSPSTADFPIFVAGLERHGRRIADHKYEVNSYVDSQNAFGGTVRTRYEGVIEQTGENEWRLISLKFLP